MCGGTKYAIPLLTETKKNEAAAFVLYQRENKLCTELDCIFHDARQCVQTVTNTIIQS